MFLVVGLGNPGKNYANTRHNIGFDAIDLLAQRNNIRVDKIKFKSIYGEGRINGEKVLLMKPQTYMNNSGEALREVYNFYKVDIEKIIVIVDDIDIGFADVRIKKRGSAGTHNGLRSIIKLLKDDGFPRIKVGIGKKKQGQDLASFVLSRFSKEERKTIEDAILDSAMAVESIIGENIDVAMNKFNIKRNMAQE